MRGGGEGSAIAETVSATLEVRAQRRPSVASTTTLLRLIDHIRTRALGEQVATANTNQQTAQTVDSNLGALRASIYGVSVDEEQANLSQYEDSVSALTQFVSGINSMMTNLVENI